jgi:hypothetical protein
MDRHQHLLVIAALGQLRRVQPFRVAAQQVQQNRQQAQALAIHHDAQLQVEPVVPGRLLDPRVPILDRGQVEGEILGVFDFPALGAQHRQVIENEAQPGAVAGQFEDVPGALRQRLALARGDFEADVLQGVAQGFFDLRLALDQQGFAALLAGDGRAAQARDILAGVAEGQGRAMLHVPLHAPVARLEGAELDAPQPQPGLGREVVDRALRHYLPAVGVRRSNSASMVLKRSSARSMGSMNLNRVAPSNL